MYSALEQSESQDFNIRMVSNSTIHKLASYSYLLIVWIFLKHHRFSYFPTSFAKFSLYRGPMLGKRARRASIARRSDELR